MELPNLIVSVPQNISEFAISKGANFNLVFSHCINRIQSDEVERLKNNGRYVRGLLMRVSKDLVNKIALNPNRCSVHILKEVETLSQAEIEWLLTHVMDEYPLWYRTLGSFPRWILNRMSFALIDDMFELDSETLFKANKEETTQVLQLVYLIGLTIPEEV